MSDITGQGPGEKLLQSVHEMRTGKAARVYSIELSDIIEARHKTGLSQDKFALQDWEQGRRLTQRPGLYRCLK